MSRFEESREVKINGIAVFPYANREDAKKCVPEAQEHFKEPFIVKKFCEGYIIASETRILDSRDFVVDSSSQLEKGVETFYTILRESISVQ